MKLQFVSDTGEDSAKSLFRSPGTQNSSLRIILVRWPWYGCIVCSDNGERLCMVTAKVSKDTELFKPAELYLGDILKWQDAWLQYWGETLHGHCSEIQSSFKSVELYSRDVLKLQDIQWWHGGRQSPWLLKSCGTGIFKFRAFYLEGWSWNGHLLVTLWKRPTTINVQASWDI